MDNGARKKARISLGDLWSSPVPWDLFVARFADALPRSTLRATCRRLRDRVHREEAREVYALFDETKMISNMCYSLWFVHKERFVLFKLELRYFLQIFGDEEFGNCVFKRGPAQVTIACHESPVAVEFTVLRYCIRRKRNCIDLWLDNRCVTTISRIQ
jgi:hypothetical protein